MTTFTSREADIAANLSTVRRRIDAACEIAGRNPSELTLIAITKTFPTSDIVHLANLGIEDCGENRDQEASSKIAEVVKFSDPPAIRWHFVGQLQSNKAASVARYASVVHSVDRASLAEALQNGAVKAARRVDVLIQVCLDPRPGRGGVMPENVSHLADFISRSCPALNLQGVMAVAPLGAPPGPAFERLQEVSKRLGERYPHATWISAGMSSDLEDAIVHGATHLRVGGGLLGNRG